MLRSIGKQSAGNSGSQSCWRSPTFAIFRRQLFAAWRTAKPALEPLATLCAVAEQCGGQRALSPGGSGPEFQTKKK